ncbi:MAG: hypothetical protein QXP03_01675 [Desulfurococcaceae archaeon]
MCRILALSKTNKDLLDVVLNSFVLSNEYDPYLERVSRGKHKSHDDGWGLVAAGLLKEQPVVAHHKSLEPIYYESSRRVISLFSKKISEYQPLYLVLHARKASAKEPYGIDYVHPFMRLTDNGAAWFVHNGGADKRALAEKLGVYPWIRVDSELLGHYVMDYVLTCAEGGENVDTCVVEAYSEAKNYVLSGSALNTVLLVLFKDSPYLYLTHWLREPRDDNLKEYYTIVAYSGDGAVFAGSITIKEYLPGDMSGSVYALEEGIYRLKPEKLTKIASL